MPRANFVPYSPLFYYRARFPSLMFPRPTFPPNPGLLPMQQPTQAMSMFCPASPNSISPTSRPVLDPIPKLGQKRYPDEFGGRSQEKEDSKFSEGDEKEEALSVNAYKRRNVYKSIVRHMFSYIRKNRESILRVLEGNGFTMPQIEHAFFKVNYLNDLERQKGKSKKSQTTVKKMLQKKTIYTFILRETLYAMMQNWKQGKTGKISQENLTIYKEVCESYYNKCVQVLAQSAQGASFQL